MKRFLKAVFGLIAFFFVLMIALSIAFQLFGHRVEPNTVVEFDIKGAIVEEKAPDFITQLLQIKRPTLGDILDTLDIAKRDKRVSGIILKIDDPQMGFGMTQELRDKIVDFRGSGKWAAAFLETAGEFQSGNRPYYLATACNEIYFQPSGDLNLIGLFASSFFYRGALDKLNVTPNFEHTGEYKTYSNQYTEKGYTRADREQITSILESQFEQLVSGIAQSRKIAPETVKTVIDQAPLTATEALENKLIDKLAYYDEFFGVLEKKSRDKLSKLKAADYLKRVGSSFRRSQAQKIAIIYAIGEILRGDSADSYISEDQTMGSDTMVKMIKEARENKAIKAIVFRVDSPGGSVVASDTIWREIVLTKNAKPVIVSMSDVAASGGYYVSMSADKIVAQPATLTGSIGVVGGKLNLRGFYNNWLGITKDSVQQGNHANIYSEYHDYTEEERQLIKQKFFERIYHDFIHKVAQGRNMTAKDVDSIGQGRVWTGEQAKRLGLIDELGGIDKAIAIAKERAHLPATTEVEIIKFPKKMSLWEQLFDIGVKIEIKLPDELISTTRLLRRLKRTGEERGVLMMPFDLDIR